MLNGWLDKHLRTARLVELLRIFEWQSENRRVQGSLGPREELEQLGGVGELLRQLPCPAVPADLPMHIRYRIRLERSWRQQPDWKWRWGNRLSPFALPAAAGLLSAIIIFGALIRVFEVPVQANSQDVPILRTPPRLRSSALTEVDTGIQCMVVNILIDRNGRVADFHIVKGKQTPEQVRYLESLLLFAVFDPATVFGKPTADTVVLALRDGHVKGYSL